MIWSCYSLGQLKTVRGDYGAAMNHLQDGLEYAAEIEHREWVVGIHFALGFLYNELFAADPALEHLKAGLQLVGELRSPLWVHLLSGTLAGTYLLLDAPLQAKEALDKETLDSLVILTEFSSENMLQQTVGRIQRFLRNKKSARVVVVWHVNIPPMAAMGNKLMGHFRKWGMKVRVI